MRTERDVLGRRHFEQPAPEATIMDCEDWARCLEVWSERRAAQLAYLFLTAAPAAVARRPIWRLLEHGQD
jgi:hypothetical protein